MPFLNHSDGRIRVIEKLRVTKRERKILCHIDDFSGQSFVVFLLLLLIAVILLLFAQLIESNADLHR